LAGLLVRLYTRRFTGKAYVSAQSRTMTLAFRDGTPVMVDSSAPESSLADDLVERGILTRDEYAELIGRVTEELVENEDVAVCEHAVSLGYLSEEQIKRELSDRVRSKLIQSLALVDCEIELDDAPDALSGVAEYPQNVGAAVYMGVRTFYEEELLRGYVPDLKRSYMRLLKSPAEIARFFELDYEEVALLNGIDPLVRALDWFEQSDLDRSHAMQLVGLLVISGMCEFSAHSFAPPEGDRSGVRSAARAQTGPLSPRAGSPAPREPARAGSRGAIPAVREEVFEPRSGSRGGMPAVQAWGRPDSGSPYDPRAEPNTSPSNSRTEGSGAFNPAKMNRTEGSGAFNPPKSNRTEGSGAFNPAKMNRTEGSGAFQPPNSNRTEGSGAFNPAKMNRTEGSGAFQPPKSNRTEGSGAFNPAKMNRTEGSGAYDPPKRTPNGEASSTSSTAQPAVDGVSDAAAEALAEARARVSKDRRGGHHYGRGGREPEVPEKKPIPTMDYDVGPSPVRTPATPPKRAGSSPQQPTAAGAAALRNLTPPSASSSTSHAASPEYQKAHLKELMQRKQSQGGAPADAAPQAKRDPVRELRSAQESLRDGQFARAEELLRSIMEQDAANDTVRVYHLWSQLRMSHALDAEQLGLLRDLAKRLVADPEHAGFACYVLAHLYFADKKDDQAEKYFRKAHALDKTNKDAERHVVILERRKQQANDPESGSQRKFLGISIGKKSE
jgi:hypothetical protein